MNPRERSVSYMGLEVPFPVSEAPAEGEEVNWTDEQGPVVFVCVDARRRHLRQVS